MARRDNRQTIAASPTVTAVFDAATDGGRAHALLLTCAADSANPIEYRVADPVQDDTDEWGYLAAGDAVPLKSLVHGIGKIEMRGVGGSATGGVEETTLP